MFFNDNPRKEYTHHQVLEKSCSSIYLKCCLFLNIHEFSFLVCREISENVESFHSNKKKYYILVGFSIYLTFLAVRSPFNVEDWNEISKLVLGSGAEPPLGLGGP